LIGLAKEKVDEFQFLLAFRRPRPGNPTPLGQMHEAEKVINVDFAAGKIAVGQNLQKNSLLFRAQIGHRGASLAAGRDNG
jgi:hypothetical protein